MSHFAAAAGAGDPTLGTLLVNIKHGDGGARAVAVRDSVLVGSSAIGPLAEVWSGTDSSAAKCAAEAIRRIVMNAGRPGAEVEAKAATDQLVKLLNARRPRQVRADSLRLLSFLGGAEVVPAIAGQMADPKVREDARLALERIPARESEDALKTALKGASAEDEAAIQQSLRHRHMKVKEVGTRPAR